MKKLSWMTDQDWEAYKTKGLNSPVIEENGRIKMRNLATGEYIFLSSEAEISQRRYEKERKRTERFNSPKEVYRRLRSNDRFWDRYALFIRETSLLEGLKKNNDPRLEQILNVRNGARELYIIEHPHTMSTNVEIAGARAILAYVEAEHPDMYKYFQSACKWLDRAIRAEDRVGPDRRIHYP